jgi:hypothetical protein
MKHSSCARTRFAASGAPRHSTLPRRGCSFQTPDACSDGSPRDRGRSRKSGDQRWHITRRPQGNAPSRCHTRKGGRRSMQRRRRRASCRQPPAPASVTQSCGRSAGRGDACRAALPAIIAALNDCHRLAISPVLGYGRLLTWGVDPPIKPPQGALPTACTKRCRVPSLEATIEVLLAEASGLTARRITSDYVGLHSRCGARLQHPAGQHAPRSA